MTAAQNSAENWSCKVSSCVKDKARTTKRENTRKRVGRNGIGKGGRRGVGADRVTDTWRVLFLLA